MPELASDVHRGWERLTLRSEAVEITIWPELGGTVSSLRRRRDNLELFNQPHWDVPPRGYPLPPGTVETNRFDLDPGGWQLLFPNGGDAAEVHGADWPLDGEARTTPFQFTQGSGSAPDAVPSAADAAGQNSTGGAADTDEDGADVVLSARLRRCPAELTRRIRLDGTAVTITETIQNFGGSDMEVMWGHQLRFGRPLIDAGTEVDCPASVVHPDEMLTDDVDYDDVSPWPRTPGESSMINLRYVPEAGAETRMAYLSGLGDGTATITNRSIDCMLELTWDVTVWPHLWYGLEAGQDEDYPWFGNGYFLTLTPNSSWPAHGLHDARRISGSTLHLDPGETLSQTVTVTVSPAS